MSETTRLTPLETVKTVQVFLVEERRRIAATAVDLERANGSFNLSWGESIREIQELIEALDRAIRHEEVLENLTSLDTWGRLGAQ